MTDVHSAALRGFSEEAEKYARGRPDYPDEILDWLRTKLELSAGKTAVDLGAGTGKFTRLLVQTGAGIVAVEPVGAMREQLIRALPGVQAVAGTAQDMPLGSASADALTCAQSFHWFATEEALVEIHRVLKPARQARPRLERSRRNGRLGLYHHRDHHTVRGRCPALLQGRLAPPLRGRAICGSGGDVFCLPARGKCAGGDCGPISLGQLHRGAASGNEGGRRRTAECIDRIAPRAQETRHDLLSLPDPCLPLCQQAQVMAVKPRILGSLVVTTPTD